MKKDEIISKIKEFSSKPIYPKIMIALGIILMIIIVFSDFSGKDNTENIGEIDVDFQTSDTYAEYAEKSLTEVLSSIEGVGKTKVLVNIASTEEYIFAEEYKNTSGGSESERVIIDNGSQKEALLKKINVPEVSGIVIVCEGGDDPKICEKVYKAVSTALKIPSSRIYVAEMK